MNSILNTLGLGPTDPATYSDASTVASQQKKAIDSLQSIVSGANTAVTFATTSGISSPYIDTLKSMINNGNTVLSQAATMKPADIQKKAAELEVIYTTAQFQLLVEKHKNILDDTTVIFKTIQKRVTEIREDKTTSAQLLKEYDSLLKDVTDSVDLLVSSPPIYYSSESGSSGSTPTYVIPSVPSTTSYQDRLDALDGKKEIEEGDAPSVTRIFRRFTSWLYLYVYPVFIGLVIIVSMILGGTIMSNAYLEAEQEYLPNRIFYFVYGALGFPLSIAYGCVKPPFWVSGLFPAYVRAAPIQSGGALQLPPSFKLPEFTDILSGQTNEILARAGIPVLNPIPERVSESTVATKAKVTVPKSSVKKIAFTESASSVLLPATTVDALLSFVVVNKTKPAQYQVEGKKHLWYTSIFAAVSLLSLGVSYKIL